MVEAIGDSITAFRTFIDMAEAIDGVIRGDITVGESVGVTSIGGVGVRKVEVNVDFHMYVNKSQKTS